MAKIFGDSSQQNVRSHELHFASVQVSCHSPIAVSLPWHTNCPEYFFLMLGLCFERSPDQHGPLISFYMRTSWSRDDDAQPRTESVIVLNKRQYCETMRICFWIRHRKPLLEKKTPMWIYSITTHIEAATRLVHKLSCKTVSDAQTNLSLRWHSCLEFMQLNASILVVGPWQSFIEVEAPKLQLWNLGPQKSEMCANASLVEKGVNSSCK